MPEPTVKIDCLFDLTDVEIAVAARKRATVETEMFKLESAFGLEKDKHKTALGKLEATAGALAELIRKGYEMRPTECRLDWDYTAKEVRTVRLDTGGVVNSRTMSDFEIGKGPRLPFDPPIALADSDPDVVAAKAAENTDATAPGAGEADAPADAQAMGEAAAEPTPAGEAASPVESEQQRKPRSDKGKARGPRKAHEPDARDPGFEAHPAATEAAPAEAEPELPPAKTLAPTAGELLLILPIMDPAFSRVLVIATDAELSAVANSEKAQRIPHLAVAVKRELRRRAGAEARKTQPEPEPPATEEPKDCSNCGHLRIYHEEEAGGCIQPDCGCVELFGKADASEEAAPAAPAAHSRACSVCGCKGYIGSSIPNGTCRECGHRMDYHLGRGGAMDPLGLGPASGSATSLDAMKDRLSGEGEAQP